MAVTSVGTPTLANTTGTSVGLSLLVVWQAGQTRTAGNTLLVGISVGAVTSTTAIAGPAGWNQTTEIVGGVVRTVWFWRIATGADAAPTFTSTISGIGGMACVPFELAGASGSVPIFTTGSGNTISTTALICSATGLAVPITGCFALTAFGVFTSVASTRTFTPGAGWANVTSTAALSQRSGIAVDSISSPTAGSTLAETNTFSTTPTAEAHQLVVIIPSARSSRVRRPLAGASVPGSGVYGR